MALRLAFMGTPDFAVPAFRKLHQAGHQVVAVYSQPPRARGRGHQVQKSSVHQAAEELDIPVYTPKSLKSAETQQEFAGLNLDIAVVAAYGLILPKAVLDAPRLGCINIHASLLPRWRGAAPIHRALLAGDAETGITIMQMDEGLDTGGMLSSQRIPITATATVQELHDALAEMGGGMAVEAVGKLSRGEIKAEPQPETGVTYAAKLVKEEGAIDWTRPAAEIERKIRALNPWPAAYFDAQGERIKALAAQLAASQGYEPGTLLDEEFTVQCGEGALRLTRVQRPNKSATDGAACLRGFSLPLGSKLA